MSNPAGGVIHSDATEIAKMEATVHASGFGVLVRGIRPEILAGLEAEADSALGASLQAESTTEFCYRARVGSLGPVAKSVLNNNDMHDLLTRIFGGKFALSDHISCYTFYSSADHLSAHRDKPASDCDVTIILYVRATSPDAFAPDTGLVLRIYGETQDTIGDPRLSIPTVSGSVVLGRGSRFWHERPPLKPGEEVIAITGCYRPVVD